MEEVRSYWQVASIKHFCTLFQKPFKLPQFEPEELEQAFILDIPAPPRPTHTSYTNHNHHNSTINHDTKPNGQLTSSDGESTADREYKQDGDKPNINGYSTYTQEHYHDDEYGDDDQDDNDIHNGTANSDNSPDYKPPNHERFQPPPPPTQPETKRNDEQDNLHLLVKLAIALLKPHFNSKISPTNWENYLSRIIDLNWVELENCPSPFNVPIISPDGIELTKNLSFNELSLSDKIDVFCALCDYRLWCDDASELIKDYPVEKLRLESVGKDQHGYEYWYFSGTRLFRENKELSQDLICRKKRIKELEYKLIELEKSRILREKEERRKAEIERAKQLAIEAREARVVAKRQQEQDEKSNSRKKRNTGAPVLPPRTGLRERRSSAASNNHESEATPTRTLRSRAPKQHPPQQQQQTNEPAQSLHKSTRGSSKNAHTDQSNSRKTGTPELPKKSPEEECKEELDSIQIAEGERREAWQLHCESLEEWEAFASKFEKTKSMHEKYLARYLNDELLPGIRNIYARKAAEIRKKERDLLNSLTTRRVSTRIISKKAQEEEEERQAQIREAELQKRKAEAELRLKAELEREIRAKKNRFVINGEASSACSEDGEESARYNLRQHHEPKVELEEFQGFIHPDKLSEFYEALELIVDTVRTSKHAWPFVLPVPETVPGYYDLIKEPVDLKKIRTKVEFREYRSLIELEQDFKLLVNNCEKFNGPKNVYTKMVYKLWKSFRKNVRLYLRRDLNMDETSTFIYPQAPPQPPPIVSPVEPQPQSPIEPQTEFQIEPPPMSPIEPPPMSPIEPPPMSPIEQPLASLVQQPLAASSEQPEDDLLIAQCSPSIQNLDLSSSLLSVGPTNQHPQDPDQALSMHSELTKSNTNNSSVPTTDTQPPSMSPVLKHESTIEESLVSSPEQPSVVSSIEPSTTPNTMIANNHQTAHLNSEAIKPPSSPKTQEPASISAQESHLLQDPQATMVKQAPISPTQQISMSPPQQPPMSAN